MKFSIYLNRHVLVMDLMQRLVKMSKCILSCSAVDIRKKCIFLVVVLYMKVGNFRVCSLPLRLSWPLTWSVSVSSKRRKLITCDIQPTILLFIFTIQGQETSSPLRKHAYTNILKILPPKNENFQLKNPNIFHISAQNIDCGYSLEPPRRGGSDEYPQSIFWAEIRKIMYIPVNPSFTR